MLGRYKKQKIRVFCTVKYTNPARGILDFCKQKFYRPLLCRPWALNSMYTQCYEATTLQTTPRTLSNTLKTLRNTPRSLRNTPSTLRNTPRILHNTPLTLSIDITPVLTCLKSEIWNLSTNNKNTKLVQTCLKSESEIWNLSTNDKNTKPVQT